jgi:hypothetical protein
LIIAKLRTLVPQDDYELIALFRFAIDEIRISMEFAGKDAEFDMLSNIYDAIPCVLRDEKRTALQEGMKNMLAFLNTRADISSRLAIDPEIAEQIGRGII